MKLRFAKIRIRDPRREGRTRATIRLGKLRILDPKRRGKSDGCPN